MLLMLGVTIIPMCIGVNVAAWLKQLECKGSICKRFSIFSV